MTPVLRIGSLVTSIGAVLCAAPSTAEARITRVEIVRVEPAFDGASFGTTGPYERVIGRAFGEVDPRDPRNRIIVDITSAPLNGRGRVEYSSDFLILRPVQRANGNRTLLVELVNRGDMRMFQTLNGSGTFGNALKTRAEAGEGFLLRQGTAIVALGWDVTVTGGAGRLTFTAPVARNADGTAVTGPALEELVVDNGTTTVARLTYPAATSDKARARLTVRRLYGDVPEAVPADSWSYVDETGTAIQLHPAGTRFRQGHLYEFTYDAKDPIVAGLAFAAVRDVADFLRHAATDQFGTPNPLAGNVRRVYSICASQPCRFLRDFLYFGFNHGESSGAVLDGMLNWTAGASGGFFNYRFAQPGRTHRQRVGRRFPERQFPFANQVTFDPVTRTTDGRLARCLSTSTCPKVFEINSENEYWVKGGSLLHTDTRGRDLADPPNVRTYLFAGFPHGPAFGSLCQQPGNPLEPGDGLRALLVALQAWVTTGAEPPASRVPRVANGTLQPALPQQKAGFPPLPGVRYNGRMTTGDLFDYGPDAGRGVLTILPPTFRGSPYPVFVPKTDADGNAIAGIRFPDVAVPLATYTGWNVRASDFGGDDLCDHAGQKIDFASTKAARKAAGDPRPSLAERYSDHEAYVKAVERVVRSLQTDRFLIPEDAARIVKRAADSSVPDGDR